MSPLLETFANASLRGFRAIGGGGAGGFELIATATGTGSSGTITFSSIPTSYKHLQIRGSWTPSATGAAYTGFMRLNGDSSTIYHTHYLKADGSTTNNGSSISNGEGFQIGDGANVANACTSVIMDILEYASTGKTKVVRTIAGGQGNSNNVGLHSGVWNSTAAINSITLHGNTNFNFSTSTRFSLYGIAG